jgi:hypothetical protein
MPDGLMVLFTTVVKALGVADLHTLPLRVLPSQIVQRQATRQVTVERYLPGAWVTVAETC